MSKTIEGVPEFLTPEQYLSLFEACGFTPDVVRELRMVPDGVHALVFDLDENGRRYLDGQGGGYAKHRVFIPVHRAPEDERTTRITPVKN
ncbi:hypothetical protein [Oerskovia paurometabola]|uniref:hypothetical protein n=1 Tax=Oerskovia paurometabola TaxID=162170 RepID=UPI00380BD827